MAAHAASPCAHIEGSRASGSARARRRRGGVHGALHLGGHVRAAVRFTGWWRDRSFARALAATVAATDAATVAATVAATEKLFITDRHKKLFIGRYARPMDRDHRVLRVLLGPRLLRSPASSALFELLQARGVFVLRVYSLL